MAEQNEGDVHDGLADVDSDLDIESMLTGDRSAKSDTPLSRAADDLRKGESETTGEDPEAEESANEGEVDGEAAGEKDGEEAGDAEETEGEGEDDGEGEGEGDPKATHQIEIPDLNRRRAKGEDAVTLVLDGLTQEQHDMLAGHVNRSQQLEVVQEQLVEAQEYETVSRFIEQNPLAAMLLIDREDFSSGKSQGVGEKFATEWMRMHPEAALKAIQKLGFHDPDNLDPERLKERAETAELKNDQLIDKAKATTSADVGQQRFSRETAAILRQVAAETKLEGEELRDFATLSAQRIRRVYDSRIEAGRDPRLSRSDVLSIIQPVLGRFVGTPANGKGGKAPDKKVAPNGKKAPAKDTIDLGKHFDQRVASQRKHAKVGGGKGTVNAQSIGISKFKGPNRPQSVKAAVAALRKT